MTSFNRPANLPVLLKFLLPAVALLGAALLPLAASAQDAPAPAPGPDTVVATVGGESITEADLSFAAEEFAQNLKSLPPDQVRATLLNQVIDLKLMAQAAAAAKLNESEVFVRRLAYLTDRAMSRAYVQEEVSKSIDEAAIRAEYDRLIGSAPSEEVHARHILVTTEEDAKAIKAALDAGTDFATLAKEKSIDPTAQQNGGDLGFTPYWQVVPPFAKAAFALKPGETSEPVQTEFGWHVINLIERRPLTKPTFEQVGSQLGQTLFSQKLQTTLAELRAAATVDIADPLLKLQINQQPR